jgi:hypothetical protein
LNKFGTTLEGVLSKALELSKLKHPKNVSNFFLHCWLLMKEVPQWSNSMEANKTPPPRKCKTLDQDLTLGEVEELQDFEVVELGSESNDLKLLH